MRLQERRAILIVVILLLTPFSQVFASENTMEGKQLLSGIEEHAENLVDGALAHDSVTVQKSYTSILQEMNTLHKIIENASFDERTSREMMLAYSWVRVISIDINQHAWIGAAIAANQLSASMLRFIHYPTLLQRDTAWMDYLARELVLLNLENAKLNAQLLNARTADLSETWGRIQKSVIEKSFRNKPLVELGKKLILSIQSNKDAETSIATAKQILTLVDKIEQVE
jgi:hypothetical protein